jgi:thymidine phosphorylase
MKTAVFGLSVAALMASAAFAQQTPDEQTTEDRDTKMAAADPAAAKFKELDANTDGRVSAIEAANDTNVAANFTKADSDKDGYLSKDEFKMLGSAKQPADSSPQQ